MRETRIRTDESSAAGALVRAVHPWNDAGLARLYDLFPFQADVPFYLELAAAQGGHVLELASGSGRVLIPLAQAGHRVVGLDSSTHMLELADEKLRAAGPEVVSRAELVQGDMRKLALGRRFDLAVIAVKSFAYLPDRGDQQRVLAGVAAHLRPGGVLAMDLQHPSPAWLLRPPGSLHQDLVQHVPERGVTLARTETVVSTDLATQIRVIRSAYEIVADDGTITKRFVEWLYRFTYRFEVELLLEQAGFEVEAIYGGYERESFVSDSPLMLVVARRSA
jgi:SAM-dependent methyltransferase